MTLDLFSILIAPLAIILVALLLIALIYDVLTFHRRKSKNETVYRCGACRNIYTGIHRVPLARCPKCGHSNAPVRQQ